MEGNEIIKGNMLIAEFMEYFFQGIQYAKRKGIEYDWRLDEPEIRDLKYHHSWDWLMPVVEKIESLDKNERVTHTYSVDITGNGTTIQPNMWSGERWMIRHNSRNNRLWNTWLSVIDFIKWYNKRKKS